MPKVVQISQREKDFARLLEEVGLGAIEAYRKAFNRRCETEREKQHARDLARCTRVTEEREEIKKTLNKKVQATKILSTAGSLDIDRLRDFAFNRLVEIRDNPEVKGATRLQAVKAIQDLADPAKDTTLIMRWIDLAWRYQQAHCPCCHKTFPLHKIKNKALDEFRETYEADRSLPVAQDSFDLRMELIKRADLRLRPHPGQIKALSAPERHIVGQGAARAGKSYVMALFALLAFLTPGVEIWILARIYDDARSEVEFLRRFLRTLFHPYYDQIVKEIDDKRTGELSFIARWGSELRVRSAKAKGSITGRELELALIVEPGWVEGDLYEEIRARMSSRLGRIIALGTPKGTSGMIGRMTRTTGRDPVTGKVIRPTPSDKLIENGCPWNVSMLIYNMRPVENPGYVKSELEAARQELTDAEYASEFEGRIELVEGQKFHASEAHRKVVERSYFEESCFVLGVDQGPKNFGAVLTAWNGKKVVPCWEFFNGDETTMKKNLIRLREQVPTWIKKLGGSPENWVLTITDRDPQLTGTFEEMEEEGYGWPTDVSLRHHNNARLMENWRRECQEWVNNMLKSGRLLFHDLDDMIIQDTDQSPGAVLLHDQVMNTIDVPVASIRESKGDSLKGWQISDPWRGDHVVDAWYFTMWTILSGQVQLPEKLQAAAELEADAFAEERKAFRYMFARAEAEELGIKNAPKFEEFFSRPGPSPVRGGGYYDDES